MGAEFKNIARATFRRWWIIALSCIAGYLISALFLIRGGAATMYVAKATVYSIATTSYQDSIQGRSALREYSAIMLSDKVTAKVAGSLHGYNLTSNDIGAMCIMDYEEKSPMLGIRVIADSADLSVKIANAMAEAFVAEIKNATFLDSVKVMNHAETSTQITVGGSHGGQTQLLGALVFGFAAIGTLMLRELLRNKIISEEDIFDTSNEVIGSIPYHH